MIHWALIGVSVQAEVHCTRPLASNARYERFIPNIVVAFFLLFGKLVVALENSNYDERLE